MRRWGISGLLAALVLPLALAGCGGPSESQRVRSAVESFAQATERHDYGKLCREVLAPELLRGLSPIGLPCEEALRRALADVRQPRASVLRVRFEGPGRRVAVATVRSTAAGQPTSTDDVRLVRTPQGWRIANLGAVAPAPAPAPPRRGTPKPDQPND